MQTGQVGEETHKGHLGILRTRKDQALAHDSSQGLFRGQPLPTTKNCELVKTTVCQITIIMVNQNMCKLRLPSPKALTVNTTWAPSGTI